MVDLDRLQRELDAIPRVTLGRARRIASGLRRLLFRTPDGTPTLAAVLMSRSSLVAAALAR